MTNDKQRERLVELLMQSEPIKDRDLNDDWYDGEIEDIADHLLANDVIVLPCKVGDVVCALAHGYVEETRVEGFLILNKRIEIITNLGFTSELNNNIFLTKEEAEEELKGGAKRDGGSA